MLLLLLVSTGNTPKVWRGPLQSGPGVWLGDGPGACWGLLVLALVLALPDAAKRSASAGDQLPHSRIKNSSDATMTAAAPSARLSPSEMTTISK